MLAPHEDPARWDCLIESVGPASILVVIGRWMSQQLRAQISPEDIWQDTLCGAWQNRGQYRWEGPRPFRAWLLEIAHNRIRDAARRMTSIKRGGKMRMAQLSGSTDGSGGALSQLPAGSTTPSRVLAHKESAAAMDAALRELPAELEPLVRMYLFEDLTMETIAERLGIGVAAAWYRFRKGSEIYARRLDWLKGSSRRAGTELIGGE